MRRAVAADAGHMAASCVVVWGHEGESMCMNLCMCACACVYMIAYRPQGRCRVWGERVEAGRTNLTADIDREFDKYGGDIRQIDREQEIRI